MGSVLTVRHIRQFKLACFFQLETGSNTKPKRHGANYRDSPVKIQRLNTCLAVAITTAMAGSVQAQEITSVDKVPSLQAASSAPEGNQCYARVSVPAEYRTEKVKTELLSEVTRYKITPPVFKNGVETVTVSPKVKKISAVQPVLEETTQKFEVMASSKQWVRGSLKGKQPLSKGELIDMKNLGVDTENAAAGTCFYEHFVEATLEDTPTKILVSEATEKLSVVDEVTKDDVFTVITSPAYKRVVEVPPTLKKGEEQVLSAAATKRWETQCGAIQQVDHMTGETLCLVDVAAQYESVATESVDIPALLTNVNNKAETKDVKIQTLVAAAQEKREVIPATYDSLDSQRVSKPARYTWLAKTDKVGFGAKPTGRAACFVETPAKVVEYKRQVVKTVGRFDTKTVPAKTTTVKTRALVSAAVSTEYSEPAKFQTIERKIQINESKIEWKPVLCQVNFSEDIIVQLQKALSTQGYEPGPIDGILGRGTTNAIRKYQSDNKMADGGLTIETLEKLGVKL